MRIQLPTLTELARSQECIDLSGESGNAYTPAIEEAEQAINDLRQYILDVNSLANHTHNWNNNGFCSICGADGNA